MKASLESHRMYVSRAFLDSVAASAVMCCVLSSSSAAVNTGDGFIDMSHAQAQCCFTAGTDAPITGMLWGPWATGSAVSQYRVASMDIEPGGARELNRFAADQDRNRQEDGLGEVGGVENLRLDATRLVGTVLAPDNAAAEENATESENPANPDATDGTGANEGSGPAPTEPAGNEFSGSPEPSGPDLTSTEEEELISGGWK